MSEFLLFLIALVLMRICVHAAYLRSSLLDLCRMLRDDDPELEAAANECLASAQRTLDTHEQCRKIAAEIAETIRRPSNEIARPVAFIVSTQDKES